MEATMESNQPQLPLLAIFHPKLKSRDGALQPREAETLAVREALSWLKTNHLDGVIVKTNAEVLITNFNMPNLSLILSLVYFDRVQFKGMRVNRTYPTIVGWSAELARKRVREENKAGSFGRGTVLPRISKPADIAAATSGQTDQPHVAALNIPSSSVDKVAGILQKLASTVGEFGEAMAEIGKQGAPVNVMRKTFSGLSNMLNVASTIEATATPTSSQLDDIFFGSESFTTAVDALIFFPVLRHGHYFLICINVKASKLEIIDNKSLVSCVTMKDKYGDCTTLLVTALKEYLALGSSALFWKVDELTEEVVDMSWKESENYIDCGLFVMRHMETYKGTLKKWNPGFKKESKIKCKYTNTSFE
nr:uncharacterized protein LOC109158994 [Ipomoea batatas]